MSIERINKSWPFLRYIGNSNNKKLIIDDHHWTKIISQTLSNIPRQTSTGPCACYLLNEYNSINKSLISLSPSSSPIAEEWVGSGLSMPLTFSITCVLKLKVRLSAKSTL